MQRCNRHVVFSLKNNFQKLQFRKILIVFFVNDWAVLWVLICTVHLTQCFYHVTYAFQKLWILTHVKLINILNKSVSAIFLKKIDFNLICFIKNLKFCVNTHYITNRGHTFLCYWINLLGWKFQSNSIVNFWVRAIWS